MAKKKNLDFSFIEEDSMLSFHTTILGLYEQTGSYIEAITSYCEDHSLDVDEIAPLISKALRENLFIEGLAARTIRDDSPRLPM